MTRSSSSAPSTNSGRLKLIPEARPIAAKLAVDSPREGRARELVVVDLDRPFLAVDVKVHALGLGVAVVGRGDVHPAAGRDILFGGDLQHLARSEVRDAER